MGLELTDADIEMILTAVRSIATDWENPPDPTADGKTPRNKIAREADKLVAQVHQEQAKAWRALELKILRQYEGGTAP